MTYFQSLIGFSTMLQGNQVCSEEVLMCMYVCFCGFTV